MISRNIDITPDDPIGPMPKARGCDVGIIHGMGEKIVFDIISPKDVIRRQELIEVHGAWKVLEKWRVQGYHFNAYRDGGETDITGQMLNEADVITNITRMVSRLSEPIALYDGYSFSSNQTKATGVAVFHGHKQDESIIFANEESTSHPYKLHIDFFHKDYWIDRFHIAWNLTKRGYTINPDPQSIYPYKQEHIEICKNIARCGLVNAPLQMLAEGPSNFWFAPPPDIATDFFGVVEWLRFNLKPWWNVKMLVAI